MWRCELPGEHVIYFPLLTAASQQYLFRHACNDHSAFVLNNQILLVVLSGLLFLLISGISFFYIREYNRRCVYIRESARFACANSTCKVPQYQPRPNSDVKIELCMQLFGSPLYFVHVHATRRRDPPTSAEETLP